MVEICAFLKNHQEINEIDLSYNELEDEGIETLCLMTLKHSNSIEHLNLSHCDIANAGMRAFYFTSLENQMKLKTLRLTGNKLGPVVNIHKLFQ